MINSQEQNVKSESLDGSNNAENACIVCFKAVEIFSIGTCDHKVCYECSTRMRVLCEQNECPTCRQSLGKVIFTYEDKTYRELESKNRSEFYNKKYKIAFTANKIQKAFYELLTHPCPLCNEAFSRFEYLKDHVRKIHEHFYCDICVEHLKIFTFERKCYNRHDLATHRRKGDLDNKSHKGHPLCEYCDIRYLDRDELFRHLRKDHYYCHFCDDDGSNRFYRDYESLQAHFRKEHFVCEQCEQQVEERIVGVFKTDIDLKAHIANVHGKSLNKQQEKQARALQLEITLGPRARQTDTHIRSREEPHSNEMQSHSQDDGNGFEQNKPRSIDAKNEQEFPSLLGKPTTSSTFLQPLDIRNKFGSAGLARTKENFPALGGGLGAGGGAIAPLPLSAPSTSSAVNRPKAQPSVNNIMKKNPKTTSTPLLIHVSNRPNGSKQAVKVPKKQDFPSLPGSSRIGGEAPTPAPAYLSNISTKPRKVVEDYVPIVNEDPFPKLAVIQKEEFKHERPSSAVNRPKVQPSVSNIMKKNPKTTSTPLLIHVSNRPNGGKPVAKVPKKQDFPSLPGSSKTGGEAPPAYMSNIAAKHRILVDDYVSVTNGAAFQKLAVVQQEDLKPDRPHTPSLTKQDFPTLGKNNSNTDFPSLAKSSPTSSKPKSATWVSNLNSQALKNKLKSAKSSSDLENNNNNNKKETVNKMNGMVTLTSSKKQKNPTTASAKEEKKKTINNNNETPVPPGFGNGNKNSSNTNGKTKPPPGFSSVMLNSVAKPTNNLTFTSSSGENFQIIPTYKYVQPDNANKRNQELVKHFKNALTTAESMEQFRLISQQFRDGNYKASGYFEHCEVILKNNFDEIFLELVCLLPDITKQQQLYLVYSQRLQVQRKNEILQKLKVCTVCKQVLRTSDHTNHMKIH